MGADADVHAAPDLGFPVGVAVQGVLDTLVSRPRNLGVLGPSKFDPRKCPALSLDAPVTHARPYLMFVFSAHRPFSDSAESQAGVNCSIFGQARPSENEGAT